MCGSDRTLAPLPTGGVRQLLRNLIHTALEPSNFSPPQDPPVCGHVTGKDKQGLHHGL